MMSWSLYSPVPHNSTGTLYNLPGVSLLVNLTQTWPLTQLHVGVNLNSLQIKVVANDSEGDPLIVFSMIYIFNDLRKNKIKDSWRSYK